MTKVFVEQPPLHRVCLIFLQRVILLAPAKSALSNVSKEYITVPHKSWRFCLVFHKLNWGEVKGVNMNSILKPGIDRILFPRLFSQITIYDYWIKAWDLSLVIDGLVFCETQFFMIRWCPQMTAKLLCHHHCFRLCMQTTGWMLPLPPSGSVCPAVCNCFWSKSHQSLSSSTSRPG